MEYRMNEVDQHVTHPNPSCTGLPMLENALLWAMRAWVIGHSRRVDVADRIGRVFDRLGAQGAARHLDRFMAVLSQSATRVLEVHCVCHTDISADEAALLHLFSLQQDEAYEEAHLLLASMTIEPGAVLGCDHAGRLALALRDAGQTLQRKTDPAAPVDPRWAGLGGQGMSQTIH
jgi:hypothetical protein